MMTDSIQPSAFRGKSISGLGVPPLPLTGTQPSIQAQNIHDYNSGVTPTNENTDGSQIAGMPSLDVNV
jgi:hypothetical protein